MSERASAAAAGRVWELGESDGPRMVLPERPDEAFNQIVDFRHVALYGEQFAVGMDGDLPITAFLILAIEAVLDIMRWSGEWLPAALMQHAGEIRQGSAERFWDAQEGAFRAYGDAPVPDTGNDRAGREHDLRIHLGSWRHAWVAGQALLAQAGALGGVGLSPVPLPLSGDPGGWQVRGNAL